MCAPQPQIRQAARLNPGEKVCQSLRQNHLSTRAYHSYDAILEACCAAWNAHIAKPARITSIATRHWAEVKA